MPQREITLWFLLPLELRGSWIFSSVEPPQTHVNLHHRHGSMRVDPPQTREKLSYDPCSLLSSVVRGGLIGLNHPKVMSNSTAGLVPCVVLRFEQAQKSWATPNSCQAPLQACFAVWYYGLNRFGRVEPPQTHEKFSYDPCSFWSSVVRGGSIGLSHPKVMSNSSADLVPCVVLRFEQVWKRTV